MRKAVQSWDPRWLPNPIWPPKWLTIPTPGFLSRTPQKPLQTRDRNSIEEESILEEKNLQWKGLFLHSVPSVEFLAKRAMYFRFSFFRISSVS